MSHGIRTRHLTFGTRADLAVSYPLLPQPEGEAPPARICIATLDVIGPIRNGGIGTAYTALADALARAGHEVTILYLLGEFTEGPSIEEIKESYRARGIDFVPLPDPEPPVEGAMGNYHAIISYKAYLWLKDREFDVIHFPEWRGLGYYSLVAKALGQSFARATLCVGSHSSSQWQMLGNAHYHHSLEDLAVDFMERRSVALADVLWSSTQYKLNWLAANGYDLPAESYAQPYVIPSEARPTPEVMAAYGSRRPVDEIVFFGRIEYRKGITLFCEAVESLIASGRRGFRVTFLGRPAEVNGIPAGKFLEDRTRDWPIETDWIQDRDSAGALEYLQGPGRLAVMPSLAEVFGLTILECIGGGVPFVACESGGIPEVIHPEDRPQVLCPTVPAALAAKLEEALDSGGRTARPAVEPDANAELWARWHSTRLARDARPAAPAIDGPLPRVSVCLVHKDRPEFLTMALDSIRAQDYPDFEVILIDAGSAKPEALAYLEGLAPDFAARGWRILYEKDCSAGAARNAGVRAARGEYVLFMDDDNVAKPDELSVLVAAARHSGADVLVPCLEVFGGRGRPVVEDAVERTWIFLGGAAALGLYVNCFGDTNVLFRRSSFEAIGGFTEDYGVIEEDWELLAKAVLSGLRLEPVPIPTFYYRRLNGSMSRVTPKHANAMRYLRPFLESVPPSLRPLVYQAQGCFKLHEAWNEANGAVGADFGAIPLRYRMVDVLHSRLVHNAPGLLKASKAVVRWMAAGRPGRRRRVARGAITRAR